MLSYFERTDEHLILLNIAADRGNHLSWPNQLTVHSYITLNAQLTLVPRVEHVQERCLSRSTRTENRQDLEFNQQHSSICLFKRSSPPESCAYLVWSSDAVHVFYDLFLEASFALLTGEEVFELNELVWTLGSLYVDVAPCDSKLLWHQALVNLFLARHLEENIQVKAETLESLQL